MVGTRGVLVVREDTSIKGQISNCRQIEIYGYVEGELAAEKVLVHPSGKLFGKVKAESAEVHGTLQGVVMVKHLIDIRSSGSVSGNIQYGQLALEAGGDLSADVRNVPPAIAGDLDLTVYKGRSVGIALADLSAVDPDSAAKDLTYTVSNARNGAVALADAPARSIGAFTQADLEAGKIVFRHDGTETQSASFDVVVADQAGATSGAPQTVNVTVRAHR